MTFIRRNVWDLGDDWADEVLWYARGVEAMKARPLADPTSWRFYAGIHGFEQARWVRLGALTAADVPPSQELLLKFWVQCQHASWYFLPWHRGYLLAFEANIRAAVMNLGGPADWALPYWNYFKANQNGLPPAFGSPDWPDGTGDNPLFTEFRFGPNGDGDVFVPLQFVDQDALGDVQYTGVSNGGTTGFGGVDTGFHHGGGPHGRLESQPHDQVHGWVGRFDAQPPNEDGLMSFPSTAGLDPIFWLHHANIDRLWASWLTVSTHLNPSDPEWLLGPANNGERGFCAPMPDDSTLTYTPEGMMDLEDLGGHEDLAYEYDDLSPDGGGAMPEDQPGPEGVAVPRAANVELVGANDESVQVGGDESRTRVRLDADARRRVSDGLAAKDSGAEAVAAPEQVLLNLENVRGQSDASAFSVYVGLGDDEDPAEHPEALVGTIMPFGVSQASDLKDEHAGQGLRFVLDVTDVVDRLRREGRLDIDEIPVRIVPAFPLPDDKGLNIGRVSVFRQGR
ncbi:tyrosinase family protein [Nocardioides ungokensis]